MNQNIQNIRISTSHTVTHMIYRELLKEYMDKFEEAKRPDIVYVTDLVACTHKFHLRHLFPELTMRFEPAAILGDLVHMGLESYLEKHGYEVEVPFEKKYKIHGREYTLKGRLDAYNKNEGIIVEIKTGRSSQNLPREHHIYQLQIYLSLLEAEKGILVYITPEKIIEYEFKRDKSINVSSLLKMLVEDTVHPKWSWECRYCPFQKICPYSLKGE